MGATTPMAFGRGDPAFLVVVLTIFGVLVFDRGIGFEATVPAAYAVTFSLITGSVNALRRRSERD